MRVVEYPETFEFADLRSCMLGKSSICQPFLLTAHCNLGRFVQVKGTVVRVNPVQTLPSVLTFRCLRCSQILVLAQPDATFTPPKKCTTPNCTSKQFTPDRTSPETQLRNRQLIRYPFLEALTTLTLLEFKKSQPSPAVRFPGRWIVSFWMIWLTECDLEKWPSFAASWRCPIPRKVKLNF